MPDAFGGQDSDKRFKMMDTDGDGKISRAEHAVAARQMFLQCDTNHDGIVTVAEMEATAALRGEKPSKHDKTAAEKIQMLDRNGDGQLTAAENEDGSDRMFTAMDTNGDGYLSKEECKDSEKAMKKDI